LTDAQVAIQAESVQLMAKAKGKPNLLSGGLMDVRLECQGGVTITADPRMFPFIHLDDTILVVLSVVRIAQQPTTPAIISPGINGAH